MISGTGTIYLGKLSTPTTVSVDDFTSNCTGEFVLSMQREYSNVITESYDQGTKVLYQSKQKAVKWTLNIEISRLSVDEMSEALNFNINSEFESPELMLEQVFSTTTATDYYNETLQSPEDITNSPDDLVTFLGSPLGRLRDNRGFNVRARTELSSFYGIVYSEGVPSYSVYLPEMALEGSTSVDFGNSDSVSLQYVLVNRVNPIIQPVV